MSEIPAEESELLKHGMITELPNRDEAVAQRYSERVARGCTGKYERVQPTAQESIHFVVEFGRPFAVEQEADQRFCNQGLDAARLAVSLLDNTEEATQPGTIALNLERPAVG